MNTPETYTDVNETGCCAVPNVSAWQDKEITMTDQRFIRMHTRSFFYMPLNMSSVMTKIQKTAEDAGATIPPKEAMILSRELSPWKAEQLYAVSKPVEGADNVTLSGTFLTKVFDGPFKDAGKWYNSLMEFAKSKNKKAEKVYMFYTTCPKCAKHYGHNYVIAMAQVA